MRRERNYPRAGPRCGSHRQRVRTRPSRVGRPSTAAGRPLFPIRRERARPRGRVQINGLRRRLACPTRRWDRTRLTARPAGLFYRGRHLDDGRRGDRLSSPRGGGADLPPAGTSAGTHRTGRSSAWLERCVRDAEVAGSSPVAPIRRAGCQEVTIGPSSCHGRTLRRALARTPGLPSSPRSPPIWPIDDRNGQHRSGVGATSGATEGRTVFR